MKVRLDATAVHTSARLLQLELVAAGAVDHERILREFYKADAENLCLCLWRKLWRIPAPSWHAYKWARPYKHWQVKGFHDCGVIARMAADAVKRGDKFVELDRDTWLFLCYNPDPNSGKNSNTIIREEKPACPPSE